MREDKAARPGAIRAANAAAPPDDPLDRPGSLVPLMTLAGALAAALLLPRWLPGLSQSLLGAEPKAFWYLSRSSAIVAYLLLWASMVFGLLMTSRLARAWPGGPAAFDLHQHTSLLGLGLSLFHALILAGDQYVKAGLEQILVPFAYAGHQPTWVGLGQIGLYLLAIVALSFSVKGWIGRAGWRAIHFASFLLFALALLHGIFSGSDTGSGWVAAMYWLSGASVLFLTLYRILAARLSPARAPRRAA